MKKFTLHEKIKKRFIITFTTILLFTLVSMSVLIGGLYRNNAYEMGQQLVNQNLNNFNNYIMHIQRIQSILAKNADVKEAVEFYHNQDERDYGDELIYQRRLSDVFLILSQNPEITNAYIVNLEGDYIYFYEKSIRKDYNMLNEQWYKSLLEDVTLQTSYVSVLHKKDYLTTETDETCVSILYPIQMGQNYLFKPKAYLICDINLSTLLSYSDKDKGMQFALVDDNDALFSENIQLSDQDMKRIIDVARLDSNERQVIKQSAFLDKIIVAKKSELFGWRVVGFRDLTELRDMNTLLIAIVIVAIIVSMTSVFIVSKGVAKSLLMPMNRLLERCNRVSQGDYEVEFEQEGSEEISILSNTIETMIGNVLQLSEQVIEDEKQLSYEKLRALQHQINPHFLNNVLQTIKALSIADETEKISRMTTLLGRILSHSVYQPYQNIELEIEMAYIENYIELQNIRHDERIMYSIELEDSVKHICIPKLTLQPLVENAIEYGLKTTGVLSISITAYVDLDTVCIIINDNGKGISEEVLKVIKNRLSKREIQWDADSIGIVNVNERLKKMYGETYGLKIVSKESSGTTVIIQLPYEKEVAQGESSTSG